jgi:hypothetical protein
MEKFPFSFVLLFLPIPTFLRKLGKIEKQMGNWNCHVFNQLITFSYFLKPFFHKYFRPVIEKSIFLVFPFSWFSKTKKDKNLNVNYNLVMANTNGKNYGKSDKQIWWKWEISKYFLIPFVPIFPYFYLLGKLNILLKPVWNLRCKS